MGHLAGNASRGSARMRTEHLFKKVFMYELLLLVSAKPGPVVPLHLLCGCACKVRERLMCCMLPKTQVHFGRAIVQPWRGSAHARLSWCSSSRSLPMAHDAGVHMHVAARLQCMCCTTF